MISDFVCGFVVAICGVFFIWSIVPKEDSQFIAAPERDCLAEYNGYVDINKTLYLASWLLDKPLITFEEYLNRDMNPAELNEYLEKKGFYNKEVTTND